MGDEGRGSLDLPSVEKVLTESRDDGGRQSAIPSPGMISNLDLGKEPHLTREEEGIEDVDLRRRRGKFIAIDGAVGGSGYDETRVEYVSTSWPNILAILNEQRPASSRFPVLERTRSKPGPATPC